MLNYLKRWFNRIVHQAIIDGIRLARLKMLGKLPPDDNEEYMMSIKIGWLLMFYFGLFMILLTKCLGGE